MQAFTRNTMNDPSFDMAAAELPEQHYDTCTIQDGWDLDAFDMGAFFTRHCVRVRRLVTSILGPDNELDDIVQDIFIQAARALPSFRMESSESTWLHRIAVNCVMSQLRKRVRRQRHLSANTSLVDQLPTTDASPQSTAEARRMLQSLYAIMETLSPVRHVAFTLFEIEGKSISEVADYCSISQAVAKSRIWFARREVFKKAARDSQLAPLIEELRTR